jgi:hypothetical protein
MAALGRPFAIEGAQAIERTLRTMPPPSSRTTSTWCGTWL